MVGLIEVKVKGSCPLIFNNPDAINNLPSGRNIDRASEEYQEQSFQCSLYKNKKGLYQPSEHFERSMELAGNQITFKGKQKYGKVLKGGIIVEPTQILHPKKSKPVHFRKWVVINGCRVLKTRGMLPEWELEFQIRVINDAINFDSLKEILEYAGTYQGIGDWRPKYGRFTVVKFTKVAEKKRSKNNG